MKQIAIKFKTQEAAEEFTLAFASSGSEAMIQESADSRTVVISSSSPRALSFVRGVAKDMHESAVCRGYANRLLGAITESVATDHAVKVSLMDGSEIQVNPQNARLLASVHDRLDEGKQVPFLVFASESSNSYQHAVGFATANERD